MGRFTNVATADASGRGNYFPNLTCRYKVKVASAKVISTRKGQTAFILELENLATLSSPSGKAEDPDGRTVPAVGDTRSWYCNLSNDAGPADMKRFAQLIGSILDEPCGSDAEVEALCEAIVDEKESCIAGLELELSTYNRNTRAGSPFTIHDFSAI